MTNNTVDFMSLYLNRMDDLNGKTIKVIDNGWCGEGLYIITEDDKWSLFTIDTQNEEIEILDDKEEIEYLLSQGQDYLAKDLDRHTSFNLQLYKNEKNNLQYKTQLEEKEKIKQDELKQLQALAKKYGKEIK